MDKVIVYGYGKIFHRVKSHLQNCDVIAIADMKVGTSDWSPLEEDSEYTFLSPTQIYNYDYDYVAISSYGNFEKIKQQLIGENRVCPDKIISLFLYDENPEEVDYNNAQILNSKELELVHVINKESKITHFDSANEMYLSENKMYLDATADDKMVRFSCPYQVIYLYAQFDNGVLATSVSDTNGDEKNISIYVVTHKEYTVPDGGIYKPISVGSFAHNGWISDSTSDNISQLNPMINECTAMYWIWKNSTSDIVGINHYRRYFYNNDFRCRENMLDARRIQELLASYDIIVYKGQVPGGMTVEQEMQSDLNSVVYELGKSKIIEGLTRYQPDYLDAFEQVMNSHKCYYCNMLVAPKNIYDSYCEWLFSFLIPVAEGTDVSSYDAKNSRIIGFFAERMLTVWLYKQDLRIVDLPVFIPN